MSHLLLLPLCGAVAGWLVIRSLVFYLFRPAKAWRFFGLNIQGLIPAARPALSARLAKQLAQWIPLEQLSERLHQPEVLASVMPGIEAHIDSFLKQRLSEKMPALALFLSDEILQTIKATLTEEIATLLPGVAGQLTQGIGNKADLEQRIRTRLETLPPEQFEVPMQQALAPFAGRLARLGLVVGLLAGLLMLLIFCWV